MRTYRVNAQMQEKYTSRSVATPNTTTCLLPVHYPIIHFGINAENWAEIKKKLNTSRWRTLRDDDVVAATKLRDNNSCGKFPRLIRMGEHIANIFSLPVFFCNTWILKTQNIWSVCVAFNEEGKVQISKAVVTAVGMRT